MVETRQVERRLVQFGEMSNEQRNLLSLPRYPGLISLQEACWLLGLVEHQAMILVHKGMRVPAGRRQRPRKTRMFISAYILELAIHREWLNKARDALILHWEEKNDRVGRKASVPLT